GGSGAHRCTGGSGAFDRQHHHYPVVLRPPTSIRQGYSDMTIEVLRAKIHRISITEANVDYVGSITLDRDLVDAAGLVEGEKVHVLNVNNGNRLVTYVILGERGSGH